MSNLLTTTDLGERWGMNPDVLARWRNQGIGPTFVRIGPRAVRYSLEAVLAYESANSVQPSE